MSAENATVGKPIIVTDRTVTVYLYAPDGSSTTSTVSPGLRSTWPPVIATDPTDTKIVGIDPTKLGTAAQPDGTQQLTYNGHLLYTFAGDTKPGDANGQGLGGVWFTLSPSGDKNA